jgi:SAM-dependent methyltransferase
LQNHKTSPDDEGTVWFSDSGAEEKMIDFLDCYADDGVLFKDSLNENAGEPTSFLDLGTGNGHLLFALRDAGWDGPMVGVDYSAKSVELAQQIEQMKLDNKDDEEEDEDDEDEDDHEGRSTQPVHFSEYDIFHPKRLEHAPPDGFNVILDKGTFDAISLSSETSQDGRRIFEQYRDSILPLLRNEGYFLITSCNWTEDELKSWFEKKDEFEVCDRIEYPSFTFGGKKGSSVVTLCFKKA